MAPGVDEAGQHGAPRQVHLGRPCNRRNGPGLAAHEDDLSILHRHRLGILRGITLHREDGAIEVERRRAVIGARGTMAEQSAESAHLLVGVGLLGGFTTFSAFSSELVTLLHRGQMGLAAGYAAASLAAGMAAVIVGLLAAQSVQ